MRKCYNRVNFVVIRLQKKRFVRVVQQTGMNAGRIRLSNPALDAVGRKYFHFCADLRASAAGTKAGSLKVCLKAAAVEPSQKDSSA